MYICSKVSENLFLIPILLILDSGTHGLYFLALIQVPAIDSGALFIFSISYTRKKVEDQKKMEDQTPLSN